ncbi:4'-phosphopantetheinyl transferase family protein [Phytohabitans sp. LJ34]|uniref:4'-phosphopantetheinyl transferase family protein n=1 Tax=Phytohabitans sp. LJ34 TaxID=3452217 RepID=UPI003F89BF46
MTALGERTRRDEVTVWTVPCAEPGPVLDRLARSLPPAERARAGALHGRRRAEYVTGRVLLRGRLAGQLRCAPHDVPLTVTASGRPEVPGTAGGGSVNLSHAGGLVAVAFSRDGAVGVDIEPDGRPPSALAWTCSAGERAWLASLPEPRRRRAFARLWTRKEACVKAGGTGINTRLNGIHCGPGRAGRWADIWWRQIPVAPGFAAAVALRPLRPAVAGYRFGTRVVPTRIPGVPDDDHQK